MKYAAECVKESEQAMMKKPVLTYCFIAINSVIYLALMGMAGLNSTVYGDLLLRYGAKVNGSIIAGESWRLLSAMFFHGSLAHLLINCFSLNAIGRIVENLYGRKRFLVIYLVAGLGGSLGSFCFSEFPSVGASGAIFGLLGAMLYLGVRNPEFVKTGFGKDILALAVLNLAYGFAATGIDNFGHLGGLTAGFLVTGVISPAVDRLKVNTRVLSALFLILFLAGSAGYGYTKPVNEEQSYLARLMKLEAQQDWAGIQVYGIGSLNRIREDSPVRIDILQYVVISSAVQQEYVMAEKYCAEMVAIEPGFGNYLMAVIQNDQGKRAEALVSLDKSEAAGYDARAVDAFRERVSGN